MTGKTPPSVPLQGSTCGGCGTDVPVGERLCAVCKDKEPTLGKPMFDVGNHPAPPVSDNPFIQGVRG